MIRYALTGALVATALVTAAFAPPRESVPAARQRAIERGRVLVELLGCNDCHTPHVLGANGPELDAGRRLSGHPEKLALPPAPGARGPWSVVGSSSLTAWAGPFGVVYASNLTPDAETGIGAFTEQQFADALRASRRAGGERPLLAPSQHAAAAALGEADVRALFTYLQSLPPVRNRVPEARAPARERVRL